MDPVATVFCWHDDAESGIVDDVGGGGGEMITLENQVIVKICLVIIVA